MRDAYQEITDRMVDALEHGTVPWRQPWAIAASHRNAVSNRPYRGINVLITSLTASSNGWEDPRWLTYRQARKLEGWVRRGEQGTQVVLWKRIRREDKDTEKSAYFL